MSIARHSGGMSSISTLVEVPAPDAAICTSSLHSPGTNLGASTRRLNWMRSRQKWVGRGRGVWRAGSVRARGWGAPCVWMAAHVRQSGGGGEGTSHAHEPSKLARQTPSERARNAEGRGWARGEERGVGLTARARTMGRGAGGRAHRADSHDDVAGLGQVGELHLAPLAQVDRLEGQLALERRNLSDLEFVASDPIHLERGAVGERDE